MSRNSKSINVIIENLNSISGLDGNIGYVTESLLPIINSMVCCSKIKNKDLKKFKKECKKYNK